MDACTLEPPGKYDGLICVRAALTRKLRKTDESIEMSFGVELKGRGGKNPRMDGDALWQTGNVGSDVALRQITSITCHCAS